VYKKSKSIFYARYLLINRSLQNLNIVFHWVKYSKKIGPDQEENYFLKLFDRIKIVVSSIASQATMRKGSSIEIFLPAVPKLYLCIYKLLFTLPTPFRKKKEKKEFRNFLRTNHFAIDFFQCWRILSENKNKNFFSFTNEMLFRKKQVNKNFFFIEKLLIFVPLHKNFFSNH
jgi:hypothetical protein